MQMNLKDLNLLEEFNINNTINSITYKFATLNDLDQICICTDDAEKEFTKYYTNTQLYNSNNSQRVLVTLDKDEICSMLIISIGTELKIQVVLDVQLLK